MFDNYLLMMTLINIHLSVHCANSNTIDTTIEPTEYVTICLLAKSSLNNLNHSENNGHKQTYNLKK